MTNLPAPSEVGRLAGSWPTREAAIPPMVAVGYLRAFITALVVAYHAFLAYCTFAPPLPLSLSGKDQWWQAFPVVDTRRWAGFDLVVVFDDQFFMAAMFLISGLFFCSSVERKGPRRFLRDRLLRLGVPFVAVLLTVVPIAYFPTYLQAGGTDPAEFARLWLGLRPMPPGPSWFIAVLLLWNIAFLPIAGKIARWTRERDGLMRWFGERPLFFVVLVVCLSAASFVPLCWALGVYSSSPSIAAFMWSRFPHYALYFLVGALLGAHGIHRGILAVDGPLSRRWGRWLAAALAAFVTVIALAHSREWSARAPALWQHLRALAFALSCGASCFAAFAVFLRFVRRRHRALDHFTEHAYGIYLVHYPCVSALQYVLLPAPIPAYAKGGIVFLGALLASWYLAAALRRIFSTAPSLGHTGTIGPGR